MVMVIVHIQRFPWHSPRPGRSCSCRFQQQDVLLQGENLGASLVKTFQGDNYWRFDPRKKPHVHSKYPQVKGSPKHLKGHLGSILGYTSRPFGSIYVCSVYRTGRGHFPGDGFTVTVLTLEFNAEHPKRVGRASQRRPERCFPLEEQKELLLQGRQLLEIQWEVAFYWTVDAESDTGRIVCPLIILLSGNSVSTAKQGQETLASGGMAANKFDVIPWYHPFFNICNKWIDFDWFVQPITSSTAAFPTTVFFHCFQLPFKDLIINYGWAGTQCATFPKLAQC